MFAQNILSQLHRRHQTCLRQTANQQPTTSHARKNTPEHRQDGVARAELAFSSIFCPLPFRGTSPLQLSLKRSVRLAYKRSNCNSRAPSGQIDARNITGINLTPFAGRPTKNEGQNTTCLLLRVISTALRTGDKTQGVTVRRGMNSRYSNREWSVSHTCVGHQAKLPPKSSKKCGGRQGK